MSNLNAVSDAQRILNVVAAYTGVSVEDIVGRDRHIEIATARSLAVWLIREHTRMSYSAIGRLFGGRDHGTICVARKRFIATLAKDPRMKLQAYTLLTSLSAEGTKTAESGPGLAKLARAV